MSANYVALKQGVYCHGIIAFDEDLQTLKKKVIKYQAEEEEDEYHYFTIEHLGETNQVVLEYIFVLSDLDNVNKHTLHQGQSRYQRLGGQWIFIDRFNKTLETIDEQEVKE